MIKRISIAVILTGTLLLGDGSNVATMTDIKQSIAALLKIYKSMDEKQKKYDLERNKTKDEIFKIVYDLNDSKNTDLGEMKQRIQEIEMKLSSSFVVPVGVRCQDDEESDAIIKKYIMEE